MKQRRKVITFRTVCGYNNDDFIHDRKTLVFYYTLNRQKLRRAMWWHVSNDLLRNIPAAELTKIFYTEFKEKLNIVNVW